MPFEWTNAVPEDNPEFQGLLEEEEAALYPDIMAELPGVALATEEEDFQVVTDKPMPKFVKLVAAALENVGIELGDTIWQAHFVAAELNAAHGDNQHPNQMRLCTRSPWTSLMLI